MCVGVTGVYRLLVLILSIRCPTVKRSPAWEGCLRLCNKLVLNVIACSSALSSHPRARYITYNADISILVLIYVVLRYSPLESRLCSRALNLII